MTEVELPRLSFFARRPVALCGSRKVWLTIHLWIGLAVGLFLSLIGVTGSALVFFHEIDGWLTPALSIADAPPQGRAGWRTLEDITAAAINAVPGEPTGFFVYYPNHPRKAFWFFFPLRAMEGAPPDVVNVFVDPHTATVTGARLHYSGRNPFENSLTGFLFKLHYALLMRDHGMAIVGVLAIIALISTVTGIVLWWPRNGKWRNAFTLKWPARAARLNYDIHRLVGMFFLPVALAVIVSGVSFNLPEQFNAIVEAFSPITKIERLRSAHGTEGPPPLDEAFAAAASRFPDGRTESFSLLGPDGPYVFNQMFPIGWGLEGRRTIYIARYGGDVLHVKDPLAGDGDGFIQWQWPLHSGYVFGWPGRIVVCLFGLSWPLLFATGVLRWLQKRRAHDMAPTKRWSRLKSLLKSIAGFHTADRGGAFSSRAMHERRRSGDSESRRSK